MKIITQIEPHSFTHDGDEVLILRRTGHDRKAHNGFTYPAGKGSTVTAPEWNISDKCGGGLHGWPWSFGLGEGQDFSPQDLWIVMGAKPADVVGNLEGGWKCKCRTATIRFEGDMKSAMDFLRAGFTACVRKMADKSDSATNASSGHSAKNASSGDSAKNASSGHSATNASSGHSAKNASSGDSSTNASSGHSAKNASSGDSSTNASSGHSSTNASSGHSSTNASSGHSSTNASSGDYATNASSGHYAKNASSGHYATNASSGHYATNEATGKSSTCACAGDGGQAKVGEGGAFALAWWDDTGAHFACGKAGVDGIKANTWYKVSSGKLVEV